MFYFKRIFTSLNDGLEEVQDLLQNVVDEVSQEEGPSTVFMFYSGHGLVLNNMLHAVLHNGSKINLEEFAVKCAEREQTLFQAVFDCSRMSSSDEIPV
jgi:hypothetical protein